MKVLTPLESLALRVKSARQSLQLNQDQAARKAGIGIASLRRVEQNQKVRPGTLRAIAGALDLSSEELIRLANGETPAPATQREEWEEHKPSAGAGRVSRTQQTSEGMVSAAPNPTRVPIEENLSPERRVTAPPRLARGIEEDIAQIGTVRQEPEPSASDNKDMAAIALEPAQQRLLACLAALPGIVPVADLAEICHEPGAEQHVSRLQAYGLISVERINHELFVRLRHRQDTDAIARGFAERYCKMALESAEKHSNFDISPNGDFAIEEQLRPLFPELKGALEWYLEHGDVDTTLRFTIALTMRPIEGSARLEMQQWLERALARSDAEKPTVWRGQALIILASLADMRQAERLCREALALFKRMGQEREVANALRRLAILKRQQGNFRQARKRFEESRALYEKRLATAESRADKHGLAALLNSYANLESQEQNYSTARSMYNAARQMFEEIGDEDKLAGVLDNLGLLEFQSQQYAPAKIYYEQSAAIRDRLGLAANYADSLYNLADVAMYQGHYADAENCFWRALNRYRNVAHPAMIAEVLEGYASLKLKQEQPTKAARLFGAAQAIRKSGIDHPPPSERMHYQMDVTATRAALDKNVFEAEWQAGREMSLPEAVEYALEGADVA